MRLKKIKTFIAAVMIAACLASDAGAISMIDWLLYKEIKLRTNTRILVHRLNGQVGYYWQSGRIIGDPDYDPEKGGSWRAIAGSIKAQFQKQYNAERNLH